MSELVLQSNSGSALSESNFQHTMVLAEKLAKSSLIPDHFKGKPENILVALTLAKDLDLNPMMCLQNISVIGGKPCIQSSLMIALLNKSGLIVGKLKWRYTGDEGQANRTCVAYAIDRESGDTIESLPISLAMAQAEGWTRNSKYRTSPDLMLQWRAAAYLIRASYSEIILGMHTRDELEDVVASGQMRDVSPVEDTKARLAKFVQPETPAEPEAAPVEVLPPEPKTVAPSSLMLDLLDTINNASDAAEMTNLVKDCSSLESDTDKEMARRAMTKRAEELGLTFNGKQKCYVSEEGAA